VLRCVFLPALVCSDWAGCSFQRHSSCAAPPSSATSQFTQGPRTKKCRLIGTKPQSAKGLYWDNQGISVTLFTFCAKTCILRVSLNINGKRLLNSMSCWAGQRKGGRYFSPVFIGGPIGVRVDVLCYRHNASTASCSLSLVREQTQSNRTPRDNFDGQFVGALAPGPGIRRKSRRRLSWILDIYPVAAFDTAFELWLAGKWAA